MLGLIEAAERFEPTRNLRFNTYAYYWVRREVRSCAMAQRSPISAPHGARETLARVVAAREHARARGEPAPTDAELAAALNVGARRIADVQRLVPPSERVLSLDEAARPDPRAFAPLANTLADDDAERERRQRLSLIHI